MFDKPQDDVDLPVPTVSEPNYDALDYFAPLKTEDYEHFKRDDQYTTAADTKPADEFMTWLQHGTFIDRSEVSRRALNG